MLWINMDIIMKFHLESFPCRKSTFYGKVVRCHHLLFIAISRYYSIQYRGYNMPNCIVMSQLKALHFGSIMKKVLSKLNSLVRKINEPFFFVHVKNFHQTLLHGHFVLLPWSQTQGVLSCDQFMYKLQFVLKFPVKHIMKHSSSRTSFFTTFSPSTEKILTSVLTEAKGQF